MAITATTVSSAVAANDQAINLTSVSAVTAPNFQTGTGITYILVEQEMMIALTATNPVSVLRGQLGTVQVAHLSSSPAYVGAPSDFPNFIPSQRVEAAELPYNFAKQSKTLTMASTLAPAGATWFHTTGTTALDTLTVPTGAVAGSAVTIVFDGSGNGLTWTANGNIAVAGTATTAASAVTFTWDPASGKWHPSRLA